MLACINALALIADQATINTFFKTVMKKLLEVSTGDKEKNSMLYEALVGNAPSDIVIKTLYLDHGMKYKGGLEVDWYLVVSSELSGALYGS